MLNLITLGDMSTAVYKLQAALLSRGFNLSTDGHFGPGTAQVLRDFQGRNGLTVDGVAGPKVIAALGLDLRPTALVTRDFEYAGSRLHCNPKVVQAITMVEAPRGGFQSDGEPVILYERHYLYRQLTASGQTGLRDRLAASDRAICYRSALTFATKYSNGSLVPASERYGPSAQQYDRLNRAYKVAPNQALESASWGKFQIMGENWSRIGWGSVHAFVRAMRSSERDHLDAFIGFCFSKPGLVPAIQAMNWEQIAELNNGASQVAHYAPKLRDAFRRL